MPIRACGPTTSVWTWAEVVAECAARAAVLDRARRGRPPRRRAARERARVRLPPRRGRARRGPVVVGINPTRRGDELARDIRHTDCARRAHRRRPERHCSTASTSAARGPSRWTTRRGRRSVDAHRGAPLPAALPAADALYLLLFTSGSTGAPKAVQMSQGRAARTAAASAVAFTPADVLYCAMPLFHGNALLANLFPGLVSAGVRRAAAAVLGVGVPARRAPSRLHLLQLRRPGAVVRPRPARDAGRRRQPAGVVPRVGGVAPRPQGVPAPLRLPRRRGLQLERGRGRHPALRRHARRRARPAAEGVDVAVVDPDTGIECPRARFGEGRALLNPEEAIGEIVGRDGLSSFEGYYANPEATAERGRDGWYWTGDLGYRDDEGTFYFAGRTADWLRVDGENFAAGPVERILGRFPGVAAVVVYAVPDPRTGDQVMAALELRRGRRPRSRRVRAPSSPSSPTSARSGRLASCGSSLPSRSRPPARSTASRCGPSAGTPPTRSGGDPAPPSRTDGSRPTTSTPCARPSPTPAAKGCSHEVRHHPPARHAPVPPRPGHRRWHHHGGDGGRGRGVPRLRLHGSPGALAALARRRRARRARSRSWPSATRPPTPPRCGSSPTSSCCPTGTRSSWPRPRPRSTSSPAAASPWPWARAT